MESRSVSVLAVGDRFVPASTLVEALSRKADEVELRVDITEVDLPYPSAPSVPLPDAARTQVRAFWEDHESMVTRIDEDLSDPDIREYTGPVDQLASHVDDTQVLLLHTAPVSRAVIEAATNLQVVGSVRTGPVNVNVAELSRRNIPLINTPGRNAIAVAEFITGSLIALTRHIIDGASELASGGWSLAPWDASRAGIELHGKTCGLIGFGSVGRAFAPIACGLGMELVVHDPYVDEDMITEAGGEPIAELPALLKTADVIVLAARINADNRHMIDARMLDQLKPSAILVNTARADLVEATALAEALESGQLAGAVVDVFDQEPPLRDHPLLTAPNTLITPHIAGASRDTVLRGSEILADAVMRYLVNGELVNCVNAVELSHSEEIDRR